MSDECEKMFTPWPVRSSYPILDRPLVSACPLHHGFYRLVCVAKFVLKRASDRFSVVYNKLDEVGVHLDGKILPFFENIFPLSHSYT